MNFGLLVPLGLLGLIAILGLIIIYIIKPNYQVKYIASTYVWKLSLKKKKKRVPVSKLRNILLFLCQLLILTAIALIMSRPAMIYSFNDDRSDVIAIIDSSASMYTESGGETRFQRAVGEVKKLSDDTMKEGGSMTVILADKTPEYLARQVEKKNSSSLIELLDKYLDPVVNIDPEKESVEEYLCSYDSADIEGAIKLCEEILMENPAAKIYLYTDTNYQYVPDSVKVVPMTRTEEWNASILNAEVEMDNGYYMLTVEVACYGSEAMAWPLKVNVQVDGANSNLSSDGQRYTFSATADCKDGAKQTIIFRKGGGAKSEGFVYYDLEDKGYSFTSYKSISVTIDEQDSFLDDNSYQIYGGRKEIIKILYSSTVNNPFFTGVLDILRKDFADVWEFRITEVRRNKPLEPFVTSGYDFYIYEHQMPNQLPTDGVVFLVDPDISPAGAGFSVMGPRTYQDPLYLSAQEDHPIMKHVSAQYISVTKFTALTYDSEYKVLMSCDTNPMLLVRNDGRNKIAVMPFSVHYSNITILPEWYFMLYNIFEFYIPGMVEENSFEVGESISVKCLGQKLFVRDAQGDDIGLYERDEEALSFVVPLAFHTPGVYKLQQTSYFNNETIGMDIFIKIPTVECNIWRVEDSLVEPIVDEKPDNTIQELLFWFAVALVSLLFVEWWLQSRENK